MTQFEQIISKVKEENLTKDKLEDYHKMLCELKGDMKMEMAKIKKAKGMYMIRNPELSVAQRTLNWKATPEGQREIELVGTIGACSSNIDSVKSRLYSQY